MDQACAVQRDRDNRIRLRLYLTKSNFRNEKEVSFDIKKRKSYKISNIEPVAKIHRITKYQSKTSP